MFVGHYAASLALKSVNKNASLGMLFLAVQFVDILFFPLVLLGIERMNIIESYTASTHFELVFMPYTHSLLAAFFWAGAVYVIIRFWPSKRVVQKSSVALVMAIAVASHWFLDLIVHTPDLPLAGDSTVKLGFGLWNYPIITFILEISLLAGAAFYLSKNTNISKKWLWIITVVFSSIFLAINLGPAAEPAPVSVLVFGIVLYGLFTGLGYWAERKKDAG